MSEPQARREGFASVPLHLLGTLTGYELAVYVAVRAHYPNAIPSQKTLAYEAGVSVRTVKRALIGLKDKGVLDWENQYRDNGGKTSNKYVIADDPSGPDRPTHRPDRPMPQARQAYPSGHTGPSRTREREVEESKGKRAPQKRALRPKEFILECPKHGLDNDFTAAPCGQCKEARQNREIAEQVRLGEAEALSAPIAKRGLAVIGSVFGTDSFDIASA